MKKYDFPVWGTQGGGLVKMAEDGRYVFVKKPDVPGLNVGDEMPEEWGLVPANQLAHDMENPVLDDMPLLDI